MADAKKNFDIVIVNGLGEHGEKMAYYLKGKLIATTTIDGGSEMQETLSEFCSEFNITLENGGVTSVKMADGSEYGITEGRPCPDFEDINKEEIARMEAAGELEDEFDCYVFPDNMDDIPEFRKLVDEAVR